MPVPRIYNSGPRLTAAKLDTLQELIGGTLPKDYRNFLLRFNGGEVEPPTFCKEGKPYSNLSMFYGLGIKDRFWDLRTRFQKTRKEMPDGVIPIGIEVSGDTVCLAVKGTNRGKVYSWDHEGAPESSDIAARYPGIDWGEYSDDEPRPVMQDDWPGHPDLTLIADSFEEFLNSFIADNNY